MAASSDDHLSSGSSESFEIVDNLASNPVGTTTNAQSTSTASNAALPPRGDEQQWATNEQSTGTATNALLPHGDGQQSDREPMPASAPNSRQVLIDDAAALTDVPSDESNKEAEMMPTDEATMSVPPNQAISPPDQTEEEDVDDIDFDHPDIQRDAANITVTAIVHIALLFFAGLFVCAVAGSIVLTGKFGFVNFAVVLFLVGIVVVSAYWVTKTIADDAKLRPVRRQIRRWRAIAKAVVVREIRDFQLDMNEHLLLMDGTADYEDFNESEVGDNGMTPTNNGKGNKTKGGSDKPRSLVFGLVVKPFLKGTGRIKKFTRRKKKKKDARTTESNEGYVPPATATSEMV